MSLSGPNSSLGVPYAKGMQAAMAYRPEVNGRKVQLIVLDDGSDPTTAGRNARKLVEEDKVDMLMGTSGVPAAIAMAQVGREAKMPMIGLTPIELDAGREPVGLHGRAADAADDRCGGRAHEAQRRQDGRLHRLHRRLGRPGLQRADEGGRAEAGIKVLGNERYARADASVTGQVLKIVALRPDAVMTGGAGTPGALPFLALAERGFKGGVYGQHGLINPDFVRVAGASAGKAR